MGTCTARRTGVVLPVETCAEYGCGTVFQLAPPGIKGKWTETVLHIFSDDGTDGYNPASGLIFDAAGNLYGTTNWGWHFFSWVRCSN
jgi:hypothetical protein